MEISIHPILFYYVLREHALKEVIDISFILQSL